MAETTTENPLLAALPPATDYLTYLTIIEQTLTEDNLPVLHQVLQDTELTSNIGWDLVHLLLGFLPASEECLEDVAARGNPREVILKVTEALRLLEFEQPDEETDDEDLPAQDNTARPVATGESSTSPALPAAALPPPYVLKFEVLLQLLATLHRRLKTKYPSRFLSTSLQAVLAAYGKSRQHLDEMTLSAVKFVKTLSGTKRPHLPPRTSSGNLLRIGTGHSEPDPEAQNEPPTVDENTLTNRLLQSFLTHILEDYVLSLTSDQDVPGLAWSSRLMEKYQPERIVPGKRTYAERFDEEESLKSRSAIVGQIVALAQDLGLTSKELHQTIIDPQQEGTGAEGQENDPPAQATDIPLSKTGALFLFAARSVKQELYASYGGTDSTVNLAIFPDHAAVLNNFIGTVSLQAIGLEPEALLDTILSLGLIALEKNNIGEPDDENFAMHIQKISLVSANTPSPSLRYQAHYLTSTILRSHPSDLVRLTFIRDTLEHCPYENLKASAVGWLKGETLEANLSRHTHSHADEPPTSAAPDDGPSIFATPVALQTVSPFLFPDLRDHWKSEGGIAESWVQFRMELSFYLATLNFYYLLLTAKPLHGNLYIADLNKNSGIETQYLAPLKEAAVRFKEALKEGGELSITESGEASRDVEADLGLLQDVISRVENGIKTL